MLDINGREKGKRAIIGGFSPRIHDLPKKILETGFVIGVNQWPEYFPCDYWITNEVAYSWTHWKEMILKLDAIKLGLNWQRDLYHIPDDFVDLWFNRTWELPTTWNGKLKWQLTTSMAAINLAIILGASEAVLFGFDLIDDERADGQQSDYSIVWGGTWLDQINEQLEEYQKHIRIIKLTDECRFNCEYVSPKTLLKTV